MCGIAGKVNFNRDEMVSTRLLHHMTQLIEHRGPDGDGHYVAGPVGLGHRRLSIIDLNTGAQPMSNEDESVWVVFNGEIYNFQGLRTDLVSRGHQFKSTSDTEVIVHLYEEFGDSCVNRLEGMFAFALWDERKHKLLLARDRVGIKPLYYANTGHALVFGSELKSIIADPSVHRRIDLNALDLFLTYYYVPGDATLLKGVLKLEPGCYLTLEGRRVTTVRYWDLAFPSIPTQCSLQESAERLRELLDRTVKSHMISDVPIGVLLSGGVDSSGILETASRHASSPLHSFTLGFSGTNVPDERPYARLAAERFGSIHHDMTLSAREFRDFLPAYARHMEEPVCEPPAIALHFVARLARDNGVKVLLSGEGADEAFAGYPEYRNFPALETLKSFAGPLVGSAFRLLGRAGWPRGEHYRNLATQRFEDYYLSRSATPDTAFNRLKQRLYGPEMEATTNRASSGAFTRQLLDAVAEQPLLNRMLYVDTKTWLPNDLLVKADKMTMAASVELRVPFLDHHMLEFAASLPPSHKALGLSLKRVLKRTLKPTVPREILKRKKAGFPIPYARWMREELRGFVQDTLSAQHSLTAEYFSRQVVDELVLGFMNGEPNPKEVFGLVALNLWNEQILRSPLGAETSANQKAGVSGGVVA